ncbi:MAG: hypothetical protein RLZZ09_1777 [Pseudomonadota bacterium]
MSKLSCRLWITLISSLLLGTLAHGTEENQDDPVQYGKDCASLIAEAPPFNCLAGEIVRVTVDGKEPAEYSPNMSCDNPAYLPYPKSAHGQCVPYSRVQTLRDDDIQILGLCRRMFIRPKDDPHFDSIEIIMHNKKTGSTCFMISKNFGANPEGDDGRRVPPPSEEAPPKGQLAARDLWATPREVADHGCIYCHDSDPWMYTPWIAQTSQLPADPFGHHSVDVGGPFKAWPKPMSIDTRGNTCTGCHRIGSLNTCGSQKIPTFGDQPPKMTQALTWMPPGSSDGAEEWATIYKQSVDDLSRCCADHKAPGCKVEPIDNKSSWTDRLNRSAPKALGSRYLNPHHSGAR